VTAFAASAAVASSCTNDFDQFEPGGFEATTSATTTSGSGGSGVGGGGASASSTTSMTASTGSGMCNQPEVPCGGACVATQSDPNNCGSCGTVCGTAHATSSSCMQGTCAIACENGFGDCDGNTENGCESQVGSDDQNCGACGNTCTHGG